MERENGRELTSFASSAGIWQVLIAPNGKEEVLKFKILLVFPFLNNVKEIGKSQLVHSCGLQNTLFIVLLSFQKDIFLFKY